MLTIENATTPVYANAEGDAIDLIVKFVEFNEAVPFTATPTDVYQHTVDLYNRAKAGEFGEIAPYVAPNTLQGAV